MLLGIDLDDRAALSTPWSASLTFWRSPGACGGFTARRWAAVLVAIRENEQRAAFAGYPTHRYKLVAFVISATITGLAGVLFVLPPPLRLGRSDPHRLLGRVARHGRHRRHAQLPRPGARRRVLHHVPRVPVDLDARLAALVRPAVRRLHPLLADRPRRRRRAAASRRCAPDAIEAAAMAGAHASSRTHRCRPSCASRAHPAAPSSTARAWSSTSAASSAVDDVDLHGPARTLHALIGPNGAGKTTVFNLISGMFPPMPATVRLEAADRRTSPARDLPARARPLVSDHEPVSRPDRSRRTSAWRPGAARQALQRAGARARDRGDQRETARADHASSAWTGIEQARPASLPMAGSGSSTWAWHSRTKPRVLLLDEPLAGLAAAERERIAGLIRRIADTSRCCSSSTTSIGCSRFADRVTVMNQGACWSMARSRTHARRRVQEVYIGSGTAASPRAR